MASEPRQWWLVFLYVLYGCYCVCRYEQPWWVHRNSSARPLYACGAPILSGAAVPRVGGVRMRSRNRKLVVDGLGMGRTASNVTVAMGDAECSTVTLCHMVCSSCETSLDCDGNMMCVVVGSQRRCLPACERCARRFCVYFKQLCACSATVLVLAASAVFRAQISTILEFASALAWQVGFMCLHSIDRNSYAATTCSVSYGPPSGSGFDSRIECEPQPLCASEGPQV